MTSGNKKAELANNGRTNRLVLFVTKGSNLGTRNRVSVPVQIKKVVYKIHRNLCGTIRSIHAKDSYTRFHLAYPPCYSASNPPFCLGLPEPWI